MLDAAVGEESVQSKGEERVWEGVRDLTRDGFVHMGGTVYLNMHRHCVGVWVWVCVCAFLHVSGGVFFRMNALDINLYILVSFIC